MNEDGQNPEMYAIIPRMFRLINELTEDQQLALLRQLLKGHLKQYLFKTIIDLTDVQQQNVLSQLENLPPEETAVKTVSLEDGEPSMRGHLRKRCLINVTYASGGRQYRDYILDISNIGVFIETKNAFTEGQELVLTFKLPNYQQPLKLDAVVVRIGLNGVGVQFKDLSPYQDEIIRSFLEQA